MSGIDDSTKELKIKTDDDYFGDATIIEFESISIETVGKSFYRTEIEIYKNKHGSSQGIIITQQGIRHELFLGIKPDHISSVKYLTEMPTEKWKLISELVQLRDQIDPMFSWEKAFTKRQIEKGYYMGDCRYDNDPDNSNRYRPWNRITYEIYFDKFKEVLSSDDKELVLRLFDLFHKVSE